MVVKVAFYTDKKNESFIKIRNTCMFFSENLESLAFNAWASRLNYSNLKQDLE